MATGEHICMIQMYYTRVLMKEYGWAKSPEEFFDPKLILNCRGWATEQLSLHCDKSVGQTGGGGWVAKERIC